MAEHILLLPFRRRNSSLAVVMTSQLTRLLYRGIIHKAKQFERRAPLAAVEDYSKSFAEGSSETGIRLVRRRFRASPKTTDNIMHGLRLLRALTAEVEYLPAVRQTQLFNEGTVFMHKLTGKKGVIFRCDPYCKDNTAYASVPLKFGTYQPFYAVCMHADDARGLYLPQEELTPIPPEKLENGLISTYLDYIDGIYTIKDARRSREQKAAKAVATTASTDPQAADTAAKGNSDTASETTPETKKENGGGDSNTLSSLPVQDTTKMETRALPK